MQMRIKENVNYDRVLINIIAFIDANNRIDLDLNLRFYAIGIS